jgi:hypothetical protein
MRRVFSVATIVIAAAVTSLNAASAKAQVVCGKRADVLTGFANTYHEVQSAIGIADGGGLIEVLVSPSGTWTMVVTKPGGMTCVIGTGREWFTRPAPGSERIT